MTKAVDFFDEFSCMGAECPYTCCKGWGIVIDEDTYAKMKKERSLTGVGLRLFTYKKKNEEPQMRLVTNGPCAFYTRDKLCGLQCMGKEELMPKICRMFPRRCIAYQDYKEASLELACYAAAKIFLSRVKNQREYGQIGFIPYDDQLETYYNMQHVDDELFPFFMKDRGKVLDFWVSSIGNFAERWKILYEHTYIKQRWLLRANLDVAASLHLPLTKEEALEANVPAIAIKAYKYAFFPISFLNEFIYGRLTESCTKNRNPFMWSMIRFYKKKFGGYYEHEADIKFEELMECMLKEYPDLANEFEMYFSYILLQTYFEAQSDCYVLSPVLHSILYTEFFMLFCGVAYLMGNKLDDEMLAGILCSVEKAVRHSPSFSDEIMDEIRKRFFTKL